MSNETRQPAGVPVGGQFATTNRPEVGTALDAATPALLTPQLEEFIKDELANHLAMVREEVSKGRDRPEDPTLASAQDSLNQMPDHILEEITGANAVDVRDQFKALVDAHGPLAALDLDALDGEPTGPMCPRHGGPWGGDLSCARCTDHGGEIRPLDPENITGAVDLEAWEPGQDADEDFLVREELQQLRARVAAYDAAATPPGPVYAHIQSIAEPAGFHPTEGVVPAMLACIAERGDPDMEPYLLALSPDDLGDLYDSNIGPAVDQLEYQIRHASRLPEERITAAAHNASVPGITEHLNSMGRRLTGLGFEGLDLDAGAKALAAKFPGIDVNTIPGIDLLMVVRSYPKP